MKTHLDTHVHRFPSADGRHWSAPELADYHDGKIDHAEMIRRAKARDRAEGIERSMMPPKVRRSIDVN